MRSALARLLHRSADNTVSASDAMLTIPFPLSVPSGSDALREPPLSAVERAFYEGSVMIW